MFGIQTKRKKYLNKQKIELLKTLIREQWLIGFFPIHSDRLQGQTVNQWLQVCGLDDIEIKGSGCLANGRNSMVTLKLQPSKTIYIFE